MCMNCGNKFRDVKELIKEKSKESVTNFIAGAFFAIVGLLMMLLVGEKDWGESLGFFALGGIIGGIFIFVGFKAKTEREELIEKQYDAAYYQKKG